MPTLYVSATLNRDTDDKYDPSYSEIQRYSTGKLTKELKFGELVRYLDYKFSKKLYSRIVLTDMPELRKDFDRLIKHILTHHKGVDLVIELTTSGVSTWCEFLDSLNSQQLAVIWNIGHSDIHSEVMSVKHILQNTALHYFVKLSLTKKFSEEIVMDLLCTKCQKFIFEVPPLQSNVVISSTDDVLLTREDLIGSIPKIINLADILINSGNLVYIWGIPPCWMYGAGMTAVNLLGICFEMFMLPTTTSQTIQPSRVVSPLNMYNIRLSYPDSCGECCREDCAGIYNYMIDSEYVTLPIKENK